MLTLMKQAYSKRLTSSFAVVELQPLHRRTQEQLKRWRRQRHWSHVLEARRLRVALQRVRRNGRASAAKTLRGHLSRRHAAEAELRGEMRGARSRRARVDGARAPNDGLGGRGNLLPG